MNFGGKRSCAAKTSGIRTAWAMALIAAAAGHASASLFTPGDLIVNTYSSATSHLTDQTETPITLTEFSTTGGAAVLTDTLPTTDGVGGSNNLGVVGEYGSSSEGNIQLAGDGRYLTFAGYSATAVAGGIQPSTTTKYPAGTPFGPTTVNLAQSSAQNVPRVAVLIDGNGNINSSTVLNDVYNENNPRSVYSANGSSFYISGQGNGSSDQGVFYGPVGLNTVKSPGSVPTPIFNDQQTRFVTAYNNNLYYSIDTSSGSNTGIWKFTGTPTGPATATRIIPGNNGLSGSNKVFYSPEGYYFANATTLYVADTGDPKAGTHGDGGIQKWTYNGTQWTLQYTLAPTTSNWVPAGETSQFSKGESGFEGITGEVVGSGASATVELFAVSYTLGDNNPNGLYAIDDTLSASSGAGEAFTELESAAGNGATNFKGVSFAPIPEPASLALLSVGATLLLARRRAGKH